MKRKELTDLADLASRIPLGIYLEAPGEGEDVENVVLRALYNGLFGAGKISPEQLRSWGVFIGGFLYLRHDEPKVYYKFFSHSEGSSGRLGYMVPYVSSKEFSEKLPLGIGEWEYYIDSLFHAHRENQKDYVWDLFSARKHPHLIPEYLAKAPFFLPSLGHQDELPQRHLYVEWKELSWFCLKYRKALGEIAGETPCSSFPNEWELWQVLRERREDLTEIEKWLIDERIDAKPSDWKCFFLRICTPISAIRRQSACLELSSEKWTHPSEEGLPDSAPELLRWLHQTARFPLLPYLYWNAFDPDDARTHLVLPIWADYRRPDGEECVRVRNGSIELGRTFVTGLAVVAVRPQCACGDEEFNSVEAATFLSKFVSLPQIAQSYYGHIDEESKARRRSDKENAIAAIAAQSMSHNIGSHALSDARLFEVDRFKDGPGLKDFHQYLQGRLDYVAQLIARTPPQPEPMYLWQDVLCEFFRQRLLLNRLIADRSVEGRNLRFVVSFGKETTTITWEAIEEWLGLRGKEKPLEPPGQDVLVAIPGGSVGRHALYSILENLMRNSVKYGGRRGDQKEFRIHFRLRDPDRDGDENARESHDYWLLEVWDNFSGFQSNDPRYSGLAADFMNDVIDKRGETRPSGHGLIEIKEAMRFLHGHDDYKYEDVKGQPYACVPDCRRTSPGCLEHQLHCCHANLANTFGEEFGWENGETLGVLVYRVRLRRPRLLGVLAPGCKFEEKYAQNVTNGVFFRNSPSLTARRPDGAESLADLAPHLLVIRDDGTTDAGALQTGIVNEIAKQHWRLPFRLFVVVENENRREVWAEAIQHWENALNEWIQQEPKGPKPILKDESPPAFLPRNRVRVHIAPDLYEDLAKPQGSQELPNQDSGVPNQESRTDNLNLAFVNRVYDHWMMVYKPLPDGISFDEHKKWRLAVCFQRDVDTIAEQWEAANDKDVENLKSLSVTAYASVPEGKNPISGLTKPEHNKCAAGARDWASDTSNAKCLIHFGNHGMRPDEGHLCDAIQNGTAAFSQEFGSSEAPRTFNLLYSPPTDKDGFIFYALSIAEAALTGIAIFDERALGVFLSRGEDNGTTKCLSPGGCMSADLANVRPLVALDALNAPNDGFAIEDLEWSGFTGGKPGKPVGAHYYAKSSATLEPVVHADVLVLHEGLIEELVSKEKFSLGAEFCFLGQFTTVIRTSGKGRDSRKLYGRLPFVEYSALSSVLSPYKDKNGLDALRLDKVLLAKSTLNALGQNTKREV